MPLLGDAAGADELLPQAATAATSKITSVMRPVLVIHALLFAILHHLP
jgi:hypothetical protein